MKEVIKNLIFVRPYISGILNGLKLLTRLFAIPLNS